MKNKTVVTVDGTVHPHSKCRRIQGEYYLIGDTKVKDSGQCYLINDKYFKYDTGYIVYDHTKQEYVTKNATLIEGVVDVDKNGDYILGHFSIPDGLHFSDYVVLFVNNASYPILNEEVLKSSNKYVYLENDDLYVVRKGTLSSNVFLKNKVEVSLEYKNSLLYSCTNKLLKNSKKFYEDRYTKPDELLDTYAAAATRLTKGLTFGFEMETVTGMVPERICRKYGLIPLRDGSIQGLEYATIPYSSLKDFNALYKGLEALERYTSFDINCALHIHVGGIPRTESFLLALFRVLCKLEDDMYSLFPVYKRINYGIKKKAYTAPLPAKDLLLQMKDKLLISSDPILNKKAITKDFDILFRYLSRGMSYDNYNCDLDRIDSHPADPGHNHKWNITTRYHWVNIIPIIFGNKQTIEFRLHTPTYNFSKIFNFMLICGCIVNYVKENETDILNNTYSYFLHGPRFTLSNLVNYQVNSYFTKVDKKVGSKISSILEYYISKREKFIENNMQTGNIISNECDFKYNSEWLVKINESKRVSPYVTDKKSTLEAITAVISGLEVGTPQATNTPTSWINAESLNTVFNPPTSVFNDTSEVTVNNNES